uniref:hypothetical protein n=1 Tax=Streptomyces chartreusis TaxID=1969 RepID=UPI003F496395
MTENSATGISYYCRWYRLAAGAPRPESCVRTGSTSTFASGGVFPSDNDVFALSFVLSTADPTRAALTDPVNFEGAASTFPAINAWLTHRPVPISPVLAMGGLHNTWSPLADESGPVATGIVGVGDTLVHTNPTLGQGAALALRTAQWVAQRTDQVTNPYDFACCYHRWTLRNLRPWFDTQVSTDRATEARLRKGTEGGGPVSDQRATIDACAREDSAIMRARARVRHLMEQGHEAYADPEIQARLEYWRSSHPRTRDIFDGPDRTTWQSILSAG